MVNKYFDTGWVKPITPVTNQIDANATDAPMADRDIVWDWTAVDIPKGTHKLVNASIHMQGEDGARRADIDFQVWFAKPIDGVEPPSLGTPNAVVTGTGHRKHMLGSITLDSTQSIGDLDPFNNFMSTGIVSSNGLLNPDATLVVNGEKMLAVDDSYSSSDTPEGYHRIYVAGITMGAVDFSTGVLTTEAVSASASAVDITVDGVDARKVFEVGDIIQAMDLAEIGTITSIPDATSVLVDAVEDALANNDEILTTSPCKFKLAFEQ